MTEYEPTRPTVNLQQILADAVTNAPPGPRLSEPATREQLYESIRKAVEEPRWPQPPQFVIHPREYDWALEQMGLPPDSPLSVEDYYEAYRRAAAALP